MTVLITCSTILENGLGDGEEREQGGEGAVTEAGGRGNVAFVTHIAQACEI